MKNFNFSQVFFVCVLAIVSLHTFAQTPTLIGSASFSASGSGSSGVPTINYNIPAGSNRVMVITTSIERTHAPLDSNFPSSNSSALAINVGGVSTTIIESRFYTVGPSSSEQIYFSHHYDARYLSDLNGLPVGNVAITFPNLNTPNSSGDEMIVTIQVFENAHQIPINLGSDRLQQTTTNTITRTVTAPTPSIGNTNSNILYLATGYSSQQGSANKTFSSGWTAANNVRVTNTSGPTPPSGLSSNENDGIRHVNFYRSGISTNSFSVAVTRGSTQQIERYALHVYAILPLAKPGVSGTVYRDNDGLNGGINNGGTGGGTWNTANTLWVNAVRDGLVVSTAAVNASGVFSFPVGGALTEGDEVTFQLSTIQGTVGQAPPAKVLPNGWLTIGESTTSGPSDGSPDGEFMLTIGTASSPNNTTNRFGIKFCDSQFSCPSNQEVFFDPCIAGRFAYLDVTEPGLPYFGISLMDIGFYTEMGLIEYTNVVDVTDPNNFNPYVHTATLQDFLNEGGQYVSNCNIVSANYILYWESIIDNELTDDPYEIRKVWLLENEAGEVFECDFIIKFSDNDYFYKECPNDQTLYFSSCNKIAYIDEHESDWQYAGTSWIDVGFNTEQGLVEFSNVVAIYNPSNYTPFIQTSTLQEFLNEGGAYESTCDVASVGYILYWESNIANGVYKLRKVWLIESETGDVFVCEIFIDFLGPLVGSELCEFTLPDINVALINTTVSGDVSTNDQVPSSTTYGTTPIADPNNPTGGVLTMDSSGNGQYTFTATTPGVYTYEIEVCTPTQNAPCLTETLSITVLEATTSNLNTPITAPDFAVVVGDDIAPEPIIIHVLDNDFAGNNDGILGQPTLVTTPNASQGTATVDGDGNVVFTPAPGFYGIVEFSYEVCETPSNECRTESIQIFVVRPDDALVIAADDYNFMPFDTPLAITDPAKGVLANDFSSLDQSSLTASLVGGTPTSNPGETELVIPNVGTMTMQADGTYSFVPELGFVGTVALPYEACEGSVCAEATLYLIVGEDANFQLPIELLYIKAYGVNDKFITVEWATATELNNQGFEIQRSVNGVDFRTLGWQDGVGTSTMTNTYSFDDHEAVKNVIYYYRLKQVDLDGTITYTNIVSAMIEGENENSLTVYPNPNTKNNPFGVDLMSSEETTAQLYVYDLNGKVFYTQPLDLKIGNNVYFVPSNNLESGQYMIVVRAAHVVLAEKVVVID